MIVMLFIYALIFIAIGLLFIFKKKQLVGWMFMLLAVMLAMVGIVAIYLYPHLLPF